MYKYKVRNITKVVDGDTVYCEVDLGFYLTTQLKLRLTGINTPELRGDEREHGLISKAFVEKVLLGDDNTPAPKEIIVATKKTGKYGRWLADIYYVPADASDPVWLNEELIVKGLAKRY